MYPPTAGLMAQLIVDSLSEPVYGNGSRRSRPKGNKPSRLSRARMAVSRKLGTGQH